MKRKVRGNSEKTSVSGSVFHADFEYHISFSTGFDSYNRNHESISEFSRKILQNADSRYCCWGLFEGLLVFWSRYFFTKRCAFQFSTKVAKVFSGTSGYTARRQSRKSKSKEKRLKKVIFSMFSSRFLSPVLPNETVKYGVL